MLRTRDYVEFAVIAVLIIGIVLGIYWLGNQRRTAHGLRCRARPVRPEQQRHSVLLLPQAYADRSRKMKLSDRAILLLSLIRQASDDGRIFYPHFGKMWSDFIGETITLGGGGDANALKGLERNGLTNHEEMTQYTYSITPAGAAWLDSHESDLERIKKDFLDRRRRLIDSMKHDAPALPEKIGAGR